MPGSSRAPFAVDRVPAVRERPVVVERRVGPRGDRPTSSSDRVADDPVGRLDLDPVEQPARQVDVPLARRPVRRLDPDPRSGRRRRAAGREPHVAGLDRLCPSRAGRRPSSGSIVVEVGADDEPEVGDPDRSPPSPAGSSRILRMNGAVTESRSSSADGARPSPAIFRERGALGVGRRRRRASSGAGNVDRVAADGRPLARAAPVDRVRRVRRLESAGGRGRRAARPSSRRAGRSWTVPPVVTVLRASFAARRPIIDTRDRRGHRPVEDRPVREAVGKDAPIGRPSEPVGRRPASACVVLAVAVAAGPGCHAIPLSGKVQTDANVSAGFQGTVDVRLPTAPDPGPVVPIVVRAGAGGPARAAGRGDRRRRPAPEPEPDRALLGRARTRSPPSARSSKRRPATRASGRSCCGSTAPAGASPRPTCWPRSCGGSAHATGKPVVACLLDVATGGAYYLAVGCDRVVALPTTITGGVGAVVNHANLAGRDGRSSTSGSRRSRRASWSTWGPSPRPLPDDARALFQEMADGFRDRFAARVAACRPAMTDADRTADRRRPDRRRAQGPRPAPDRRARLPRRRDRRGRAARGRLRRRRSSSSSARATPPGRSTRPSPTSRSSRS